jgi:hypothetical protein
MLSLVKCREILGCDSPESDAELELRRDRLYAVARVAVDAYPRLQHRKSPQNAPDARQKTFDEVEKSGSKPAGFSEAFASLPDEDRYDMEERAAIMEFDGGLDRDAAEQAAFSLYRRGRYSRE